MGALKEQLVNDTMYEALTYLGRGWSVMPIGHESKRPIVKWKPYQTSRPTYGDVAAWWRLDDTGIGIITGALSGIVVVDVDDRSGGQDSLAAYEAEHGPLPATVTARTGGGGLHLYFRHPGGRVPNAAGISPGIDIRGDGGYVVAPPSMHASGRRYEWLPGCCPDQMELADLPPGLLEERVLSIAPTPRRRSQPQTGRSLKALCMAVG